MRVGQRVQLTATITALGYTAHAGQEGEITGVHTDGYFTVRLDTGRETWPTSAEIVPATGLPMGATA
ncbi:hypothetical protein ACFC8F_23095 [Streptomyces hydrogenans]|uniref:hypothetical protein n=1 Tax=Streptomyces hydrogenans TaxID=1873719 RepID=UPI0035D66383